MTVIAGTSKGVFRIDDVDTAKVLGCRGVRDLAIVGSKIFAGTGAGVFVSQDRGRSWSGGKLTDREVWQTRGAADGAIYASTQPAGLFRSENDGDQWNEVRSFAELPEADRWCVPVSPKLPGRARALVLDAADARRIWVGVEVGGIARSTDGGGSWQFGLPGDNPDLHMMCAHPADPTVLFASTGYGRLDGVAQMIEGNAGVFRSDDAGVTWKYVWKGITPRYSRPMCIDPRPPFGLTVASAPTAFSSFKDDDGAEAMLFRTNDRGESWRSICDPAHRPSRENIHGLAPDPENPGGVVIGTDTGEVWRVSDDASWGLVGEGMPAVLAVLPLA